VPLACYTKEAMQFQVPQFIEVEDKIFGPLTFKQFVYIGGGLGTAYILFRLLPLLLAAPLMIAAVGLAAALAFFQLNGRPFIIALESAFYYLTRSKLYLWNNDNKAKKATDLKMVSPAAAAATYVPRLSDSRLHDLAWSLDINERIRAGTAGEEDREENAPRSQLVAPVRTARSALVR